MGVAALPISELRGAIPLALVHYQLPPLAAYLLGVVGNLMPVVVLLPLWEGIVSLFGRVRLWEKSMSWLFACTRSRFRGPYARWGAAALVTFVAVPLPMTGAWTGCLIAFLFGIPFRLAFPLIAAGVMIAGLLVTLSTLGVLRLL